MYNMYYIIFTQISDNVMIMNLKPKENLKLFLPEFTVKPPNLIHGSGLRFYNHIAWEN